MLDEDSLALAEQLIQRLGRAELFYLKPTHVSFWPEHRITVAYDTQMGRLDGRTENQTLVITARLDELPDGIVEIEGLACNAGGWLLPHDPYLPGVERISDIGFDVDLLDELEIAAHGIKLEMLSYSPGNHGVFQLAARPPAYRLIYEEEKGLRFPDPAAVLYLKSLRPYLGEMVFAAHERLVDRLPVPRCRRWMPELGLLALEPVHGMTLWESLRDDVHPPPSPESLLELLDRMSEVSLPNSGPASPDEVAEHSAVLLKALLPEEAGRVDEMMAWLGTSTPAPNITVHGDFHESQMLVGPDGVCGLLDLDDSGPGERIDDLAMLIGRLWSYGPFSHAAERIERYADELFEAFSRVVDPRELYRRSVSVAFSRASNPFRYQEDNWREETIKVLEVAEERAKRA